MSRSRNPLAGVCLQRHVWGHPFSIPPSLLQFTYREWQSLEEEKTDTWIFTEVFTSAASLWWAGCLRSAPPLPIINDFTRSTPHLRYAFDCVFRCENPLKLVCELAKPQLWLDAVQAGTWDVERENRCRFRFFRYARSRTCPSTLHKTSLSSYELVWLHFPTSWRPQHSVLGRMRCFPFTCPVCSVVSLSQQHDDWYYVTSFYVSVHELQLCKAFLSAGLCSHSVSLSL